MSKPKTMTMRLHGKDPDVLYSLRLTDEQREAAHRYFEFGEYWELELEVDGDLNILSARFVEI